MKNNPSGKYGKVHYSLGEFGLNEQIIKENFSEYMDKYSKFF